MRVAVSLILWVIIAAFVYVALRHLAGLIGHAARYRGYMRSYPNARFARNGRTRVWRHTR